MWDINTVVSQAVDNRIRQTGNGDATYISDDDAVLSFFRKILFWSRCTGGAHPSIRCAHVVVKTLLVSNSSWPHKLYSVHSICEQCYSALGRAIIQIMRRSTNAYEE